LELKYWRGGGGPTAKLEYVRAVGTVDNLIRGGTSARVRGQSGGSLGRGKVQSKLRLL